MREKLRVEAMARQCDEAEYFNKAAHRDDGALM